MSFIPVNDLYEDDNKLIKHSIYFPRGYQRIVIVGSSESGKTFSLRTIMPNLCYPNTLTIICPNVQQPTYRDIVKIYRELGTKILIMEDLSELKEKILDNKELHKNYHNIVIVDDLCDRKELENKSLVALFSRGRQLNISTILICQNYVEIPNTIKKNITSLLVFTHQNPGYIYTISGRGVFIDMKEFIDLYNQCTKTENGDRGFMRISINDNGTLHPCLKITRRLWGVLDKFVKKDII